MCLTEVDENELKRLNREDALEEGLEKGLNLARRDIATKLLQMEILSDQQIVQATGLSFIKLTELKKELQ